MKRTKHGFDCGNLRCEALTENLVRVLNLRTGKYVDVQTTPKGMKQYVTCGQFGGAVLAGYVADEPPSNA